MLQNFTTKDMRKMCFKGENKMNDNIDLVNDEKILFDFIVF